MAFIGKSFILWIGLLACACAGASSNRTAAPASNAADNAVATVTKTPEGPDGQKLYMDNCAACHKENGTGGRVEIDGKVLKPDDLTSAKIKSFPDEKIARYIRDGVEDEGMPAFKEKLKENEIAAVVRFLRTGVQTK